MSDWFKSRQEIGVAPINIKDPREEMRQVEFTLETDDDDEPTEEIVRDDDDS
jgi:hypothetical protein